MPFFETTELRVLLARPTRSHRELESSSGLGSRICTGDVPLVSHLSKSISYWPYETTDFGPSGRWPKDQSNRCFACQLKRISHPISHDCVRTCRARSGLNYTRDYKPRKTAGNGNRTRMASLEGWNFTIKLCPRFEVKIALRYITAKLFFMGFLPTYCEPVRRNCPQIISINPTQRRCP